MNGSITVRLNNGQRYSAQNLQTLRRGWGSDYETTVLVFECSGVLTVFPVEDVAAIELNVSVPVGSVTISGSNDATPVSGNITTSTEGDNWSYTGGKN